MVSVTELLKRGGDAVQVFERIDELFKRVEQQGAQIVELQSEVTILKTLLDERTKSLERLMTVELPHKNRTGSDFCLTV